MQKIIFAEYAVVSTKMLGVNVKRKGQFSDDLNICAEIISAAAAREGRGRRRET